MPETLPSKSTHAVADYARFVAWMLPSFIIWLFGEFILRPKTDAFITESSPVYLLVPVNNFLFYNFWFIVLFLAALTVLLEVLCNSWRGGGRRISLSIVAWIFHVYVLVSTALIAGFALVAAEVELRP